MKIKKILMYVGIVLGLFFVIFLGWMVNINKEINEHSEIIPEEEISDDQLRQTIVTLYFGNKEFNNLEPEARQIDIKKLMENPYKLLIDLLIEGPKNEDLIKILPEGTELNNIEINNNIVYIDFSEDFIKDQNLGEEKEKIIINSILKTLIELNEVNGIKILINGEENKSFPDEKIIFNNIFYLE